MKIDSSIKTVNGLPIADVGAAPAKVSSKTDDTISDSFQISNLAAPQNNGVFDTSKVDAIKLAIADGRFEVDTGKVADGLINAVKDLLKPATN